MTSTGKGQLNLISVTLIILTAYLFKLYIIPFDKETKLSLGYFKDSLLNFTELTKQYGYVSEEHDVVTEDGYILTVFRIPKSTKCQRFTKTPPVLLLHGLIESADLFLDAGTTSGLAYLLSDNCFDVWVGNQRGNYYGRRHMSLNPDRDAKFWDFTREEMGLYDVPATINYILDKTSSEKVNFIGYSQGAATLFIMCSEKPEFCQKVKLMIALGPAVLVSNTESTSLKVLSRTIAIAKPILEMFGINEVLNKGGYIQELSEYFCQYTGTYITDVICGTGGALFDNFHPGSTSYRTQKTLFGHFPAGTSVKNFVLCHQMVSSRKFQKYDYGRAVNLERYGHMKPPEYNLSAVTVPVVTVYGKNDLLTVTKDIKTLEKLLPNLIESVEVAHPLWTHLDMVYSQYSHEVVFPTVKRYLDKYSDV